MSVAIKVENLTKIYKMYEKNNDKLLSLFGKKKRHEDFYALKDVSFEINRGECVGIIGHNGAGKSTLLKILTGVAFPTEGKIEINGKISSLLELGSGFNPELTGIENVYFNGALNGRSTEQIDAVLEDIIEFADIGDFINQPVKSYSSGMFARLAFAVAINIEPDILIVDEILSVGDVSFQVKCMAKFEEFKKKNKTIIYVSHGLGTVKKFCDRAIWLQKGQVMDDGNSVIVVERYYNINFNQMEADNLKEQVSESIENVEMVCLNDKIKYDDKLDFEIKYTTKKKIDNPNIILELRKTDYEPGTTRGADQFVCAFNSIDHNKKIPNEVGENKTFFSIDGLNLMAGVYYFDAIILTGEEEPYRKVNVCNFTLDDKYRGEGFIILKHTWGE